MIHFPDHEAEFHIDHETMMAFANCRVWFEVSNMIGFVCGQSATHVFVGYRNGQYTLSVHGRTFDIEAWRLLSMSTERP